jgi:catechol 2,3-dioxygenase-like lactoylglutathione lyase family enzyme
MSSASSRACRTTPERAGAAPRGALHGGLADLAVRLIMTGPASNPASNDRRTAIRGSLLAMAVIERLDFLGVPTRDPERSRAFYRDVLGMRPDEHAAWEQWAGDTCFGIWEPEKQGMPFVAQKGNPWPLRCDDVGEMRAALEAKGVQFFGDTIDTGVCHMAIFADPDGNELMLHRRYASYE